MSSAYETLAREGLLTPEETAAVNRVEPLAEVMFLMMAADGKVTDTEKEAIKGAIRGLADDTLRSGTIQVMLENFEKTLKLHGRDERLREIAETVSENTADAEAAFALAAAVALADDDVADEENAFINQLAEWFGISSQRASELLDALEADQKAIG
jgi:tellurite resistance protein